MLPQLLAEGTKVSIIIATDGCNYNLDNVGTDANDLHEISLKGRIAMPKSPKAATIPTRDDL